MRIRRRCNYFEYLVVRTREGNGVLHVLYQGPYLSQKWLSEQWEQLHGSPVVWIEACHGSGKGAARYVATQYVAGQDFARMFWSYGWVFKGFVSAWLGFKRRFSHFGKDLLYRNWTWLCETAYRVRGFRVAEEKWWYWEVPGLGGWEWRGG